MVQTINLSDFRDAFRSYDRKDNFSYEGLELLFDMFEELDPNMELDVIAICCDYSENDWQTIANEYNIEFDDDLDDDDKKEVVRDYLNDNTYLVGETSEGFVYQAF